MNFVDSKMDLVDFGVDFVDLGANFVGLGANFLDLEANFVDLEAGFVGLKMDFGDSKMNLVDLETDFVGLGMDFADRNRWAISYPMAWLAISKTHVTACPTLSLMVPTTSLATHIGMATIHSILGLRAWRSIPIALPELRH
ncbi:hypothetical protein BC332_23950 [Capsicum chinense]|nr:hypothetical protein BC332_23950 [Capsicum chinense]